ncbi:MAG: hypothetical protein PHC28_04360 [Flavobacterium sp.]|uniref:hypothetical protein n=1 Tax=Flavobacterium sp. TaxID=239 RepID=UPI002608AEFC|nr:hypothetical protein [Flavobacterium sp.]MDD5149697.1 hypothetical protein [Flavobacterium sp.]
MKFSLTICCLLLFTKSFSQTATIPEKIITLVETYFSKERESIHVQFNKTIYVNNEDIAFKGYVFNKNRSIPFINTTNVQLVIYDEQKKIIQKQILFSNIGSFDGVIHLNEKFTSGKYYFHFYTNWMNNFIEDESFIQTVEIINKNEPYHIKSKEPVWETTKITVFPEGGIILNEISNRIGIQVTDCNKKGIEIHGGTVVDSKSNEIAVFNTNATGNGNFYFIPNADETYFVKIKSEKINLSQVLPKVQNAGLVISYNNNLPNNILAIVVKTNSAGIALYQNKKLNLIVHQNGNLVQKEFSFSNNQPEQMISFSKLNLLEGVNTIRVIDEDLNEVAERLIFIDTNSKPITTLEAKTIKNDSISLIGKTDIKEAHLSISVLPELNIGTAQNQSIIGTFYLNSYLNQPETETYSYFDTENKTRKQDIELLLLNQPQNKYLWNNIKSNSSEKMAYFSQGVTIKVKVNKKLNPNSKYKISLISPKNNIFNETILDKNNEYEFKNIFAQDSTAFFIKMTNEKNEVLKTPITISVSTLDTIYSLPINWEQNSCPSLKKTEEIFTFNNLGGKIVNLESITIKNSYKKKKLIHKEGNSFATAFKIDEKEIGSLLDFIGRNGYQVGTDTIHSVYIRSYRNVFGGKNDSPEVFINDMLLPDLNLLTVYSISEIDEIYFDKMGTSSFGGKEVIKVYLKSNIRKDLEKSKLNYLLLTKGFTKSDPYKITAFGTQKELDYFGTLNWSPNISIKDNPNYEIKFPKGNQKEIQVLIEGFSVDGQLISEIKKIPVTEL